MGSPSGNKFSSFVSMVVLAALGALLIFGGVKSIGAGMPEDAALPACPGVMEPQDRCLLIKYDKDFLGHYRTTTETMTPDENKNFHSHGPLVGYLFLGGVMILLGGALVLAGLVGLRGPARGERGGAQHPRE
ncbi:hypothetical protein K7711_30320 [Nocardia sp. CA2R105]|uniref:hypothetical protein n=1 Tax=Nocardia coffeae TaxID=2873381 RepID=UPI001CA78641|nr:hypothetical protein [Nocardia coffeae]MBY8860804.1 hypothetical protein [Nocardia coffeae]